MFRRKHWKYITFTILIKNEVTRIVKNGEVITKNMSCISQFIDRARFMASSSSNLVNNLSEGIYKTKSKHEHEDEKCETCGISMEVLQLFSWIHKF